MRRWLLLVYLFLIAATVRADVLRGTWHLSQRRERMHLELTRERSDFGHSIELAAFGGLTSAAVNASTEAPVHFQLVRDAGTFDFTGTFLNADGVGRFTFTPDASYAGRLQSMGVASSELTDDRLYSLAALDVSAGFIRDMQALGYRESLDRYIAFRIHGVTPPFARDLRALGVTALAADRLVAMRIHGVTTDYVRELRDLGYANLSSEQLVAMRIHGVSTQFIRDLAAAGYHGIPVEKLVAMRIHGVDADFARKVK